MEWYQKLILTISIIGLGIIISSIISHLVYHRSLTATIVEAYLRITTKRYDDQVVIDNLKKLPQINDIKYNLPKTLHLEKIVTDTVFHNMQVLIFNHNIKSNKAIVYLHGGAYVRLPRYHHMKFLKKLALKTRLPIYVPLYPKVPNHNVLESYELLTKYYLELKENYQNIYVIGDSSGGGLALGLCQSFIEKNISQPAELILLSPWVDVTLSTKDIKEYEKKEPLLSISNTKIWGMVWADQIPLNDYRVSPINGNMAGLKSVNIFVGTREILYPENQRLLTLLKDNKINVKYFEGQGLNHVYPIYPIPEARKALKQIVNIISKNN